MTMSDTPIPAGETPPTGAGRELSALRESLIVPDDVARECADSSLLAAIRFSVAMLFLGYALHGLFPAIVRTSHGYAFLLEIASGIPAFAMFGGLSTCGMLVLFGIRTRLVLALWRGGWRLAWGPAQG